MLSIFTIIFLILGIIEYNLIFGFKIKYLVIEILAAALLYLPVLFIFAGILHPLIKSIWKEDISIQILLDNIPNYYMLFLNIKIFKEKSNRSD
jgi:hypothetical protein